MIPGRAPHDFVSDPFQGPGIGLGIAVAKRSRLDDNIGIVGQDPLGSHLRIRYGEIRGDIVTTRQDAHLMAA